MVDGNAYLSIGDSYKNPVQNMFRQPTKGEKLTPFVSKMYPTNADGMGNFTKIKYVSRRFMETNSYREKIEQKPGFGTKDASKTDEFCNNIRMEQYRQVLRKEAEAAKKSRESNAKKMKELLASRGLQVEKKSKYAENVPVYDIGRTRVNEYSQKLKKDSFYRPEVNGPQKFLGPYMPTALDSGWDAWNYDYKPPVHGGDAANSVKNFNDKSHLKVGR